MCTAPGDDVGPPAPAAVKEEERTIRAGDGADLREFLALPATGFRRGAVLIIHDIWGYTEFYKDLARRITEHGHAAALVDFLLARATCLSRCAHRNEPAPSPTRWHVPCSELSR